MKLPSLRLITAARISGVALFAALLAGCSGDSSTSTTASAPGTGDTVIIRGSNTIGEELAPALIAAFKKTRPNAVFDTEFKGTSYGIGALMVKRCDLAAASRPLTTNEIELAKPDGMVFNDYVIGDYSVAVVVNSANALSDLKPDQVRDIFTGKVTNWKDVGGSDAPIHLYIRNPISGTYLGFQELTMERKPYGENMMAFTNHVGIVQAVAKDPNGIGYTSFELLNDKGVKAVSIDGVTPTVENVNSGKYPYARILRFYTDKSTETPLGHDFVTFAQSPEGQKIMAGLGFVPHP